MKGKLLFTTLLACAVVTPVLAQSEEERPKEKRFTIGGYGEAVMTRNYYSQHFNRYRDPESHANDESHGQFDIPHAVLNLGYNFGKGWTFGMEVEFEHGGTESAVEVDADEAGEYEAEVERGGEVALEQFWINKEWLDGKLNLKFGEIVIPVGETNAHHMPNEFFTVYRPEGESIIFPCTWHQVGAELWGRIGQFGYELLFTSGLDSERFGAQSFIHDGAGSPYEFKIANTYAVAGRIDNYSIPGLRLSLSGYYGNSFKNTLRTVSSSKYGDVKGTVAIGAFGLNYKGHNWIVRGNADFAYLSDASLITSYNNSFPTHSGQDGSPSKHQPIGSHAYSYGVEAGWNVFSQFENIRRSGEKLYIFGRYEKYDSMSSGTHMAAYRYLKVGRMAVGLNYVPLNGLTIKAEYSKRFLTQTYNDEPSVSIGVTYAGWFNL